MEKIPFVTKEKVEEIVKTMLLPGIKDSRNFLQ